MNVDEHIELFLESFSDAIESWFSCDIACCDRCYDEFLAIWPHAYEADDAEFQRSLIDLDMFYEGSRLAKFYSKEEFDQFKQYIRCPRCGKQLGPYMWPYDFPFDIDYSIEQDIKEIAQLAKSTPFLLLTHEYSRRVYEIVNTVASTLKPTTFNEPLYRARKSPVECERSSFDRPPRHLVKEGRYNHAGNAVLYLASDTETCFEEIQRKPCIVAEIEIKCSLTVLDLLNPSDSHNKYSDDLHSLTYSALMSAKQSDDGWHKPAFVFSRFVGDCVRASGIQAIRYPSTRITKQNFNLAIVDPEVTFDTHAEVTQFINMGGITEEF